MIQVVVNCEAVPKKYHQLCLNTSKAHFMTHAGHWVFACGLLIVLRSLCNRYFKRKIIIHNANTKTSSLTLLSPFEKHMMMRRRPTTILEENQTPVNSHDRKYVF